MASGGAKSVAEMGGGLLVVAGVLSLSFGLAVLGLALNKALPELSEGTKPAGMG